MRTTGAEEEEWKMEAATTAAAAAKAAAEAATTMPKGTITPALEDGSKVSLKDIYMRLCACRDFEIKLQWERAVFLTAFLIACFAGYGSFLLSVHVHGYGCLSSLLVKCIPVVISFVGIVLSLLWILMAKGSKAWYEHYEQAIAAFAKKHATTDVPEYVMAHRWYVMPEIFRSPMSNGILNFKGGAYSVSKIVIAIGICSLMIWGMLFLIHCGVAIFGSISKWEILNIDHWVKTVVFLLMIVGAFLLVHFQLTRKLGSGYMKNVKSILMEVKDFKVKKTAWTSTNGLSARDWIKGQKTGRYVLVEKGKITIYEYAESEVKEETVNFITDCIPEQEIEDRLYFCE